MVLLNAFQPSINVVKRPRRWIAICMIVFVSSIFIFTCWAIIYFMPTCSGYTASSPSAEDKDLSAPTLDATGYSPSQFQDSPLIDAGNKPRKYAYASLLCDDGMISAAQVLIYSMKKTGTPHPFLFLLLPNVSESAESSLVTLGAVCLRINMLDYPFPVNAEKVAINKMCRYSKLHIWSQTQYDKVVFVDVDMLVVRNLDDIFSYPQFSAVKDAGDAYNTGLFVLQPDLRTYQDMIKKYVNAPSYNHGDQGFINYYFSKDQKVSLPIEYNVMVKNKIYGQWPEIKKKARIFHLTSETKPWSFYFYHHKLWKDNFEASIYYQWNRAYNQVCQILQKDVYQRRKGSDDSSVAGLNLESDNNIIADKINVESIAASNFPSYKSLLGSKFQIWPNLPRMAHFCDDLPSYDPSKSYFVKSKFSVLIHKFSNITSLVGLLESLQDAPFIEHVFVSWPYIRTTNSAEWSNNDYPDTSISPSIGEDEKSSIDNFRLPQVLQPFKKLTKQYSFVQQSYPSYSNKFAPLVGLITQCLFLLSDEDIAKPKWYDLELGFSTWKSHQSSLVGFRPYNTLKIPMPEEFLKDSSAVLNDTFAAPASYSILSANGLYMHSDYLYIYTCLFPQSLHRFVDECRIDVADLALNLMVMGMTGSPPIAIVPPVFNPKRWLPESPFEVPRRDKMDGRAVGPLIVKKKFNRKSLPVNPTPLLNLNAINICGMNQTTDMNPESFMANIFFSLNSYMENAFSDILTQNDEIINGRYKNTANFDGKIPSNEFDDSSTLDAMSLDNSRPLDVLDDPVTLHMKEAALKDMALHFFHLLDPNLPVNWQFFHPNPHINITAIGKKLPPKGVILKSSYVASRFEKIPFTKMSLKKWQSIIAKGKSLPNNVADTPRHLLLFELPAAPEPYLADQNLSDPPSSVTKENIETGLSTLCSQFVISFPTPILSMH